MAFSIGIFYLAFVVFLLVSLWKIFEKAGQPGWAALIPIYNTYIMTQIAKRPGWWTILLLIPYLNFIFSIIVMIDISKRFGKGIGFAIGLILLPIIFLPILAFGDAKYEDNMHVGETDAVIDQF